VADDDRSLALAADIERRDGDVAAALGLVAHLSRRAEDIRVRCEELQLFLDSVPGELARLERSEAEARDAAATAAAALAEIEKEAVAHRTDDVEQALESARRTATESAARHRHVVDEQAALRETETLSRSEIAELVRQAVEVAHRIEYVPTVSQSGREPPGETLAELAEWGRRVHAALFVVRGQLEAERDRLIREANELAGAVLGEQLAGSSVALVRRRLEEALRP
jgi:chromosome segregation ATPase